MKVVITETIHAQLERVFEVCTDVEGWQDVISAIDKLEMLSDGPVGVGTRFRETRTMMGREATEVMEVTAFEPPRRWVLEAASHGAHYVTETTFAEQDGGGVVVHMEFGGTGQTVLAKVMGAVMGPMMKGAIRKALEQDFADLKAACEAQ